MERPPQLAEGSARSEAVPACQPRSTEARPEGGGGGAGAGQLVHKPGSQSSRRRGAGAGDLAGCRPGPCYLCTMSLISLTEPSSLLKSCAAAGPPPAAAGQTCSSRRLLSSLLMASRKANLFLICWMEST